MQASATLKIVISFEDQDKLSHEGIGVSDDLCIYSGSYAFTLINKPNIITFGLLS